MGVYQLRVASDTGAPRRFRSAVAPATALVRGSASCRADAAMLRGVASSRQAPPHSRRCASTAMPLRGNRS